MHSKILTFTIVSAAWKKNETIIKRLQNIPASLNDCPALDPLQNNTKVSRTGFWLGSKL